MYRHLSLDIPREGLPENADATVKKCLDDFFEPEELELKCEKCTEGTTASQTLRLLSRYVLCLCN